MGSHTRFAWQHHARPQTGGMLSMFDDEGSPPEASESRGLVLALDESARTAKFVKQFTHPLHLLCGNQGSCQLVPGGGAVIGWGDEPYVTEFAADGSVVLDGQLPNNDQSYRAFRSPWTGAPDTAPAVAVDSDAGKIDVYASWNGATEVASWRILAGKSASALEPLSTSPRTGFETTMSAVTTDRYIAVAALDGRGRELARSTVQTV
jgi:hypothetical protein